MLSRLKENVVFILGVIAGWVAHHWYLELIK